MDITAKSRVVVRRLWHNPEIVAFIDTEAVGASMQVSDFVQCLIDELYGEKSTLLMLSKQAATVKLLLASEKIIHEMKQTTAHVV